MTHLIPRMIKRMVPTCHMPGSLLVPYFEIFAKMRKLSFSFWFQHLSKGPERPEPALEPKRSDGSTAQSQAKHPKERRQSRIKRKHAACAVHEVYTSKVVLSSEPWDISLGFCMFLLCQTSRGQLGSGVPNPPHRQTHEECSEDKGGHAKTPMHAPIGTCCFG